MSRPNKILVAGIGNIFLGDDAFGSEVARRLMQETLPAEVRVRDFGIRSYDLAYAMMDGYDVTILVDSHFARPVARHSLSDRARSESSRAVR